MYYTCEGRGVKIMEGEDCFRRGLSRGFKLPFQSYKTAFCVGKNDTYQKKNGMQNNTSRTYYLHTISS